MYVYMPPRLPPYIPIRETSAWRSLQHRYEVEDVVYVGSSHFILAFASSILAILAGDDDIAPRGELRQDF
jgi:hypothetical protein